MIRTKGRKVTRPGGMTGASNKGVKVNVPSSNFLIQPSTTAYLPRFVYWMKGFNGRRGSSAHTFGAPAHAGQERWKGIRGNSISYRSHRVKVEGQIVQSVEHAGERFLRRHQVA